MPNFKVTWEIEVDAETPLEAAQQALEIQRDPESIAWDFMVVDQDDPFKRLRYVDTATGNVGRTEHELRRLNAGEKNEGADSEPDYSKCQHCGKELGVKIFRHDPDDIRGFCSEKCVETDG